MKFTHTPVLLQEVIDLLNPKSSQHFIDLTLGGGGHSYEILKHTGPDGKLFGVDADPQAIAASKECLKEFGERVSFFQGNFSQLADIVAEYSIQEKVSGVLLDLGVSSYQLSDTSRGFSFQTDGPLNMNFGAADTDAAEILNTWSEEEIARILCEYGEEWFFRAVARQIVKNRPYQTTDQLVHAITLAYRGKPKPAKIHFATKTFQALRIAVNNELSSLKAVLPQVLDILSPGGRIVIITFHALEDRIVKDFFRRESTDCLCPPEFPVCRCGHTRTLKIITSKGIAPSPEEVAANPRSRTAKVRAVEKLPLVAKGS